MKSLISKKSWSDTKNEKSGVYVMSNINMPNIYKVGYINRESTLEDRIKELERSEWVTPGSIKVEIFVPTSNPKGLESSIHCDPDMTSSRLSPRRELFERSLTEIFLELKSRLPLTETGKMFVINNSIEIIQTNTQTDIKSGQYESDMFGVFSYKDKRFSWREAHNLSFQKFVDLLRSCGYGASTPINRFFFRADGTPKFKYIE